MSIRLWPALAVATLAACTYAPVEPVAAVRSNAGDVTDNAWYRAGREAVERNLVLRQRPATAKNVILFIGDGMSLDTIAAARIFAGQQRNESGEENWLTFESLPHTALMKTYNTDLQVPDSAGTATALLTGIKTRGGVIGVDDKIVIGDCATLEKSVVGTFLEQMESRGKATGVVTTTRITHATPAATYAHSPSRDWENDRDIPMGHRACRDIARQLVEFDKGDGIEVAMGGGRAEFLDATLFDPEYPGTTGARSDGRNLIAEWQSRYGDDARFVWNLRQLENTNLTSTRRLLGLFEPSHMKYDADRRQGDDDPSLAQMTARAIDLLARNRRGFFLLVEGGRIDHAHHEGNAARALHETLAFDAAVRTALARVDLDETLIIVTADHGHTLNFSGYPVRGNPILGKVHSRHTNDAGENPLALDNDGRPYTTLNYANGPGYRKSQEEGRPDLTDVDTTNLDYLQEATIPLPDETHSGTDVIVYADGPGAHLFRGVQEQNYVYHVMRHAVGDR